MYNLPRFIVYLSDQDWQVAVLPQSGEIVLRCRTDVFSGQDNTLGNCDVDHTS
jgi:hypothetical protein